jgi:tetratricopeptide (TPR) repeat protein
MRSDKRSAKLYSLFVPAAGLAIMVAVAYEPVTRCKFIWDDDDYVVSRAELRNAEGLRNIWVPTATPQYYPLVFTSFWIEFRFAGLNAELYHWDNIILHGMNVILLWCILRHLAVPGAWLAAAIFALHPVHVESVAWITERKNMLSGFFYLSALLAYLRFDPLEPGDAPVQPRWYFLSLGLYVCALLSKTVTCSLPAAIVLLLWWKRGKLSRRDALALAPFFALGLAFGLLTAWLEKHHVRAEGAEFNLSLAERALIAGRALWFYIEKLAWPANLTFIYPRWKIEMNVWWQYLYPLAFIGLVAALWQARHRIGRGPLVAILYFAGTLFPALGFFDVYPMRYSFVADHFQYLASIGVITLAAASLTVTFRWLGSGENWFRWILANSLAAAILAVLGGLTRSEVGGPTYYDKHTLWTETLRRNPECWLAHDGLGSESLTHGQLSEAEEHFRAALAIDPHHPEGNCGLGVVLLHQAKLDSAKGRTAEAHRKIDDAITHFRKALDANHNHYQSQTSLGLALADKGEREQAKEAIRKVFEMEPNYGEAHLALATVFFQEGSIKDAEHEVLEALRVEPNLARAHDMLGRLRRLEKGR